tara:strand:- start:2950 stop:3291 length:342 start_codon:yes stop_codon:yes gene_type:complete
MGTRYDERLVLTNDLEEYAKVFEQRGVKQIKHYSTAKLHYPTPDEIMGLQRVQHVWKVGDRYYKLAAQYYGIATFWWVIAHYNKKPTESQLSPGDVIYIPLPLARVLGYLTSD